MSGSIVAALALAGAALANPAVAATEARPGQGRSPSPARAVAFTFDDLPATRIRSLAAARSPPGSSARSSGWGFRRWASSTSSSSTWRGTLPAWVRAATR